MPQHTERLAEVGPIDPRTGFPFWYEDSTGIRLELVREPGDDNAPGVIDADESGPLRGITQFPGESFYLSAEARLDAGAGDDEAEIRVVLALEATFTTEEVLDGQQIVFGRVRFRVRDDLPGTTHKLTHPYGTVEGTTDDRGRVTVTEDIGRAVYSRGAAGDVVVEVLARSIPGQQLTLSVPGLPETPMQGGDGIHYVSRIGPAATVPDQVTVTNLTDPTPVPTTASVTEAVEITQADYDAAARTLTVAAASSDQSSPPALTVTGRGGLSGPVGALADVEAPPPVITVESAAGGSSTRSVRVVG